jgi:hypothetical protein
MPYVSHHTSTKGMGWDNWCFSRVVAWGDVLATLDYELTIEERDGYLYACVEADEISFEMIIEYTNRIVQHLKASNSSRLLLHTRAPVLESTDCYEIASYIVRNALSRDVKIAVVDKIPGHAGRQEKISMVSRSAGLDLKWFDTIRAGEEWLLEEWLLKKQNGKSLGAH